MDSAEISRVMQDNGLASDPAFRDLNFILGALPNILPTMEGHVLGLYYPDGKPTIVLPRDAGKSTLLHEVGHRYGHYYYGNISEDFAESFRKKYDLRGRVSRLTEIEYFNCPDCETRFLISGDKIQCPNCLATYRWVGPKEVKMQARAKTPGWNRIGQIVVPYSGQAARVVSSIADYTWTFNIRNYPGKSGAKPNPGDDIFVDVEGEVNDIHAGYPDRWRALLAAAVVDTVGNIDISRYATNFMPSSTHGSPFPYSNKIKICDLLNPLWAHMVLGPAKMPNTAIIVQVRLYACHDDTTPWDWSLW